MSELRKGITKSVRFSIFSRDNFTCRYCGRQSDQVKLVIDHLTPVCQGGGNDPENLFTSCEECNQGKGGKTIGQSAPSENDRLRILQEHQEQISIHAVAVESSRQRKELRQDICNYFCESVRVESMGRSTLSVLCHYAQEFGLDTLFLWIDIAVNRFPNAREERIGRYISGIRNRTISEPPPCPSPK